MISVSVMQTANDQNTPQIREPYKADYVLDRPNLMLFGLVALVALALVSVRSRK
jgi:hypothetical protein